jgi:hypothetical protein
MEAVASVVIDASRSSTIVSQSTSAKLRSAATASSEAVAGQRRSERLAEFLSRLGKQKERNRLRRQQRCVDD